MSGTSNPSKFGFSSVSIKVSSKAPAGADSQTPPDSIVVSTETNGINSLAIANVGVNGTNVISASQNGINVTDLKSKLDKQSFGGLTLQPKGEFKVSLILEESSFVKKETNVPFQSRNPITSRLGILNRTVVTTFNGINLTLKAGNVNRDSFLSAGN